MTTNRSCQLLLLAALLGAVEVSGLRAQTTRPAPLTVDAVMKGPALVGYPPSGMRWAGDSSALYFEWRRGNDDEVSTWVVPSTGGEPRRLTDDERRSAPPVQGVWDRARRRVLAVQDGDIVVIDTVTRGRLPITRTSATERAPRWARNESHVTFVRDDAVFIVPAAQSSSGVLVQLCEAGPKKAEPRLSDAQSFLKAEERTLLVAARDEAQKREREEARRKRLALPRFELAERQSIVDAVLTADERYLVLTIGERPQVARQASVPAYITESAYSEMLPARTKVGDAQETRRLAVLDLATGESGWLDLASAYAPGANAPVATGPGASTGDLPAQTPTADQVAKRQVRWGVPIVSRDGAVIVSSVRADDNEDRWFVRVDAGTRTVRVIDHLRDPAWVREGFGQAAAGFLSNDREFYFTAERSTWNHLFVVDATSPSPVARALTDGAWEVQTVDLSADGKTFYYTSNEADPGERHVYVMRASGGDRVRLTTARGGHDVEVSPDGARLALISSTANTPPELYLRPVEPGAASIRVTTSPTPEWQALAPWVEPPIVRFTARDGAAVPARLYTPEMVGARRDPRRPGVVFVHGAGYLQNAHRFWSSYSREYMFHHLLAQRGYVVLDVDYRGSAGYGRAWRTAVFRHMGGRDPR